MKLAKMTTRKKLELAVELFVLVLLIFALAFHIAEVGIIGLGVIILLTSFKGITHEHYLGDAFKVGFTFYLLYFVSSSQLLALYMSNTYLPLLSIMFLLLVLKVRPVSSLLRTEFYLQLVIMFL